MTLCTVLGMVETHASDSLLTFYDCHGLYDRPMYDHRSAIITGHTRVSEEAIRAVMTSCFQVHCTSGGRCKK